MAVIDDGTCARNVIYGVHNGDGVIRYVGRTNRGLPKRAVEHLHGAAVASITGESGKGAFTRLHVWMSATGTRNVCFEILQALPDDATADDLEFEEARWIHQFTWTPGHPPLLNVTRSKRFRRALERMAAKPPTLKLNPKEFWK